MKQITNGAITYSIEDGKEIPAGFEEVSSKQPKKTDDKPQTDEAVKRPKNGRKGN